MHRKDQRHGQPGTSLQAASGPATPGPWRGACEEVGEELERSAELGHAGAWG